MIGRESHASVVVTLLLFSLVGYTWSCSEPIGWKPPTLVDNILMGKRVLYGRPKNTFPDLSFPRGYGKVFTVEFEVYCVLKGETTPQLVNITGAGYIPGLCTSTRFTLEQDYVAILHSSSDGQLRADRDIKATKKNLAEVEKACGLNPATRPEESTSTVVCPASVVDCQEQPSDRREKLFVPTEDEEEESDDVTDAAVALRIKSRSNGPGINAGLSTIIMTTAVVVVATLVAS